MKYLAIALIRVYQRVLSPSLPSTCRFVPTCSQYGLEAITHFGILKGGWLALQRVLRCHPFNPGGYDPVPYNSFEVGCSNAKRPTREAIPVFQSRRRKTSPHQTAEDQATF